MMIGNCKRIVKKYNIKNDKIIVNLLNKWVIFYIVWVYLHNIDIPLIG